MKSIEEEKKKVNVVEREGYRRMVETWKCDKKKQCHTLEGEEVRIKLEN